MRLTASLLRQHIGFHFKKHWIVQGKRVPRSDGAEEHLAKLGIPVIDPKELLKPKRTFEKFDIPPIVPPRERNDETHPLWKAEPAYVYGNSNVLLEGVRQAQCLLNTVVYDGLPMKMEEKLEQTKVPLPLDRSMQQSVLSALVFDTEQVKTAVVKVPDRPAFKLPRTYGISNSRKNRLILSKLVTHAERCVGRTVCLNRKIIYNTNFLVPLMKDSERILLDLQIDSFVISNSPIAPLDTSVYRPQDQELPTLFPVKETNSLPVKNLYDWTNEYPINQDYKFAHPHTVLIHCSPEDVKNLHEFPVSEDQVESRTMLKVFAVAAARARQLYGDHVKALPCPITVQAIQTDNKSFHFSVYQLNTLDLSSTTDRNLWFRKKRLDLYSQCGYLVGKPSLVDYNKSVLKHFVAFYGN